MTSVAVTVLVFMLFISGILGFVFNGILLIFSLLKRDLRVGYCWFLIGMASANFIYCINVGVLETFALLTQLDPSSTLCIVSGVALGACGYCSCLTQPLLALNRYSSLFYKNGHVKRFCLKNISVMLFVVYSFAFGVAMFFLVYNDYGKFENALCTVDMTHTPFPRLLLGFAPLIVAYCITAFFGVKVALYIKKHEANVRQRELRTSMKETKQLVKLMFLEVIVPILLETPALVIALMVKFAYNVPDVLISLALGLFVLHATTDPVVVMLVVKPYRTVLRNFWKKLRNKNSVQTTNISEYESRF